MFALMTYVPGTEQRRIYKEAKDWMKDVNLLLALRGLPPYSTRITRNPDQLSLLFKCVLALVEALEALDRGATTEQGRAVLMEHLPT